MSKLDPNSITDSVPKPSTAKDLPILDNDNVELSEGALSTDTGLSYLMSRGISNESTLAVSQAGSTDSGNAIIFPYIDPESGNVMAYKYKYLEPKHKPPYKLEGTHPGGYVVDIKRFVSSSNVIIVEGELDALSVDQYLREAELEDFTVIATTGITNRNCIQYLERFDNVYMFFDNEQDKKKREIVKKAEKQLLLELLNTYPTIGVFHILPPSHIKDANDYLQGGYSPESFKKMIDDAEEYLDGKVHREANFYVADMLEFLEDEIKTMGTPTLFDGVDKALGGGIRLGEITALQAEAKQGKNAFYHARMFRWLKAGIPIGYASRELSPDSEVLPNILSIDLEQNMWLAKKEKRLTPELCKDITRAVSEYKLYFAHGYGVFDLTSIVRWVQELKQLGVQFFFIDHMHYCLHDPENAKEISTFIRRLKQLAKEENIHIDIIIQPKYIGPDQRLGLTSLRGGSAIGQAIDNLFIFKRYDVPGEDNISELTLEVARHRLAKSGSKVYFKYDPTTTQMEEVDIRLTDADEILDRDNAERGASGFEQKVIE